MTYIATSKHDSTIKLPMTRKQVLAHLEIWMMRPEEHLHKLNGMLRDSIVTPLCVIRRKGGI